MDINQPDPLSTLIDPSRIVARVPALIYTVPGSAFPCSGTDREKVLKNIEYVGSELARWQISIAILSDEAFDLSLHTHSFEPILRCLSKMISNENCKDIDTALRAVFPRLERWPGCVIRTNEEYGEILLDISRTQQGLAQAVLALGGLERADEEDKKGVLGAVARIKMDFAQRADIVNMDQKLQAMQSQSA